MPGPANTTRIGRYVVLTSDGASPTFINGGAGTAFTSANDAGQCSVAFPRDADRSVTYG